MTITVDDPTRVEPSPGELVDLDPAALLAASNVRKDLGDLTDLVASVKALGVLQPPVVARAKDGYSIVFGARRVAAAIAAGRSPVQCIVRDDLVDAGRVVGQLAENLRRQDLSAAEEAAGYEQLAAFGLDVGTIAEQVGSAPERVETSLRLARAPKALAVAAKYSLGLEESAAIAEFDDDAEAVKSLTVVLMSDRPGMFPHVVSRLRQDRADAAARAEIIRNLGEVPLLTTAPEWQITKGQPVRLEQLRNDAGKPITPAKHRKCPGHAAWIEGAHQGPKLVWVCADPVANKHKDRYGGTGSGRGTTTATDSPAAKEKASQERRTVIANNKAWRAAEPVRQAFLDGLYAMANPPKGALSFAVGQVLRDRRLLADHCGDGYLDREKAVKALAGAGEAPAKLTGLLMREVCRAMESSTNVDTWRRPYTGMATYLRFLESAGYALSDVEVVAITASEKGRGW